MTRPADGLDESLEMLAAQLRLARSQALATMQQIDLALRVLGIPTPGNGKPAPVVVAEPERPAFNRPRATGDGADSRMLESLADAAIEDTNTVHSSADALAVTDPVPYPASVHHD